MALGDVVFLGDLGVCSGYVDDKGILDAEDGVRGFVGVVADVEGSFYASGIRQLFPVKANDKREGNTYVIRRSYPSFSIIKCI